MGKYKYTVTNKQGKQIQGTTEAQSKEEVAKLLQDKGLSVISIEEQLGVEWSKLFNIQLGGVPLKEKVAFVKQLATMIKSGMPIIQSLDILVQQTENDSLREQLQNVYDNVSSGMSLSDAFSKERVIFSDIQINLLVAGEKSGKLVDILQKIAEDMEKSKDLRGKLTGAMIYPAIILVVLVLVVVAMLVFMVPSIRDLYQDFGESDLPWVTQFLVNLSNFITNPLGALSIIGVVIFSFFGFRYYYSTYTGKRAVDGALLKLPVFGNLLLKIQLAQFNRLLSLLLKSGVSIVDSLEVIANSMSNAKFSDGIKDSAKEVTKGNSLTVPLSKGEIFPVMMLKMLATGEETGSLDEITEEMGKYYEKEVNDISGNLTKLLEPMIMVVVGGVVAFMALAIYMPIFQLSQISVG